MKPETLRKAIEYADGWFMNWDRPFCDEMDNLSLCKCVDDLKQYQKAALAAQLVDQVDAMSHCLLVVKFGRADVWDVDSIWDVDSNKEMITVFGPNRTDNTIEACVQLLDKVKEAG